MKTYTFNRNMSENQTNIPHFQNSVLLEADQMCVPEPV